MVTDVPRGRAVAMCRPGGGSARPRVGPLPREVARVRTIPHHGTRLRVARVRRRGPRRAGPIVAIRGLLQGFPGMAVGLGRPHRRRADPDRLGQPVRYAVRPASLEGLADAPGIGPGPAPGAEHRSHAGHDVGEPEVTPAPVEPPTPAVLRRCVVGPRGVRNDRGAVHARLVAQRSSQYPYPIPIATQNVSHPRTSPARIMPAPSPEPSRTSSGPSHPS